MFGVVVTIGVRDGVLDVFEFGEFVFSSLASSGGGEFVEGFRKDEIIH